MAAKVPLQSAALNLSSYEPFLQVRQRKDAF